METGLTLPLLLAITGIAGGIVLALRQRLLVERKTRRQAEDRLNVVLENAPVAIGVLDGTGKISLLNNAFRKQFGYESAQLQTLDDWWPVAYPNLEDRLNAQKIFQQMIKVSHDSGAESPPREMKVTCGDGTVKDVEFHYIDLGRISLWTLIDTTEHHRIEDAARLANDHLLTQLGENSKLQEALREQVNHDPLTHLYNRRYLDETLEREISRAVREGYPIAVMMLDIDHFKRLNDTYGHLAGDEMLKAAAVILGSHARTEDVVCRFGGEEFAIVLPKMPLEIARNRAEFWRTRLKENIVHFGSFELQATISIGIAAFPEHGKTRDELIDAADRALYCAKEKGRNRIELANTPIDA